MEPKTQSKDYNYSKGKVSRGFGFVNYKSSDDADMAIKKL